jgi:hypothetical protein
MSTNDDAGSERKRLRLDDDVANFVYTSQENVPKDVIHVQVHPSIKVIRAKAFLGQSLVMSVELLDEIKVIEKEVFEYCRSLRKISPPLHQGDQERGISLVLGVDDCDSQ